MTSIKKELTQERKQERLVKHMKLEKVPTFKSHEVQFILNEVVKFKLDSGKAALQETPSVVEGGEKLINENQHLIRIADGSEHGWATIEEYEEDIIDIRCYNNIIDVP